MISGLTSSLYQSQIANQIQQMRATFQRLGTDLSSGNIAAAQQDFSQLEGAKKSSSTTTSGSQTSIQQEMRQLGQDLQSGNVSAAQQDYASIQRSAQQSNFSGHAHHHHGTSPEGSSSSTTTGNAWDLMKNLASTAATAYGSGGLTTALNVGSMLSQEA